MTYEQTREQLRDVTVTLDPETRALVTELWGEPYADEVDRTLQHSLHRMLGFED